MAFSDLFKHCIESAKVCGKMLAYSLVLRYPFKNQSISLIGFSLGTQIIMSCVEELYNLKAYGLVNNIYLLAGATTVSKREEYFRERL
jgi:hypothetical protein